MRNISPASSAGSSNRTSVGMQSPVSYLLGGIGSMFALILFALLLLACSYFNKPPAERTESNIADEHGGLSEKDEFDKKKMEGHGCDDDQMEERVVAVVMAGDDDPTFIAKPAPAI